MLSVARRDIRSWFGNPVGYVFIVAFVLWSTWSLMTPQFFMTNLANLDTLNAAFPWILLLFVPALTMGAFANERSSGTQELLFTLPASEWTLLLGKYLAAAGIYTIVLAFSITVPIGLTMLGIPDWGQLFCNYLGFWLLGLMLISVALVASQLVNNLAVAWVLGVMFGAIVLYFGWACQLLGLGPAWFFNSPLGQFAEFARGMVPLSGVVLFAGLTAAFLILNHALLRHRTAMAEDLPGVHGTVRCFSLAVGTAALTVIAVHALPRFDGTIERIHSLGAESRRVLASLDAKNPVTVTAFVSENVPQQLIEQKRNLLNLLDQFDSIGGAAVERRVVITEPYSPEARDAEKNYGIQPRTLMSGEAGSASEDTVYLGFVVQAGTEEIVTPFVEPAVPLEYELTRSIRVAANAGRRKVGVLKTDVELYGGFDFQSFRQKQRWQICDELQQQYKVENVDADQDYKQDLDALVVPQASSLSQEQMDRLAKWIEDGHPTLLLEDPAPLDAWGTAADDQKGGARAQLMGQPQGMKGEFGSFLGKFAIGFPRGEVVWDFSGKSFMGGRLPLEFVFVSGQGLDAESSITKGLQNVVLLMAGHIREQKKDGFTFQPLLTMQNPAKLARGARNGVTQKLNLFQFDPFGGGPQINPYAEREQRNGDMVIAARITGKPAEGKQKGVDLIYVGDLDLVGNQFFQIRRQVVDPNLRFDNVTFVLNCIDSLVGDESLTELRKRRPILRKLTRIEESQQQFEADWAEKKQEAESAAKKELADAQKRLDDAVAKIRDNKELDEQAKEIQVQTVQEVENRKFELAKAKIEDDKRARIEEAAHKRDVAKNAINNGYRLFTLILAPLPAMLVGFLTYFRRRARERAIVPQNRMVTGGGK
jgi:ABC-2 type transport system permease protein